MTDGIVFVVHGGADERYAAALGAALGAFPAPLPASAASGIQFGAGSICIVVWTQDLQMRGAADNVAHVVARARLNTVICRLGGAPAPPALAGLPVLDGQGEAVADAAALREALQRIRAAAAERGVRKRGQATPRLGAASSEQGSRIGGGRRQFAVRSAYGMAATLAVAGVAASTIGQRAQATGADPQNLGPNQAHAARLEPSPATLTAAQAVFEAAPTATPALDAWLAAPPEAGAMAIETSVPAPAVAQSDAGVTAGDADETAAAPFDAAAVDPKRQGFGLDADEAAQSATSAAAKAAKASS
jgi:hypothetical protein